MDSTDHHSVKLIFQAHLRMYSLTHTGSFAETIADTNRQSCTTAQAALFQGIFNVQAVQCTLTSDYIQNKVQYNQENNT
jgi:hypothetical protein